MKQMANAREPYFAKVGTDVVGCNSVEEVMGKAGLDWEVDKRPVYLSGNKKIPDWFATVRSDTKLTLGMVKSNYSVVQNREAFGFIDECLGEGITFSKAGTYDKGKRIFVVGTAPSVEICGDEVYPQILFTNSHDGSSGVSAEFTPMRLVCANGLMVPIAGHEKGVVKIRISHTKRVKDRLQLAKDLMVQNNLYIDALRERAEMLAATPFTDEQFQLMTKEIAGVKTPEDEEKISWGQQSIITD